MARACESLLLKLGFCEGEKDTNHVPDPGMQAPSSLLGPSHLRKLQIPGSPSNAPCYSHVVTEDCLFKARIMLEERPSLHALETIVRRQLAAYFAPDEVDSILAEAEGDNPAAYFVVASALESAGKHDEAMRWFRRSAEQGYHPALERLRRTPPHAA